MTLCLSRNAMAMAYSATTVLPADVCAATITDSLRSRTATEVSWNASSVNGYALARGPSYVGLCSASRSPSHPSGMATSCTHDDGLGAAAAVSGGEPTSPSSRGSSRLRFCAAARTALADALGALCAVGRSADASSGSTLIVAPVAPRGVGGAEI